MTRDEYISTIKNCLTTIGIRGVMSYLTVQIPVLKLPVLNQITEFIVKTIVEISINKTEISIFVAYIDIRTSLQADAFEKAAMEYELIQRTGTSDQKKEAEEKLIYRARCLIKFSV